MGDKVSTPMTAPASWKEEMQSAGFVDVNEKIYKVPHGIWPKDERLKKIGAFENHSLSSGLEAYLLRGYVELLGGDPERLQIIIAGCRRELRNPKMRSYVKQ